MGFFGLGGGSERRRHERVATARTASAFGQVLDLSESGACLFRKGSEGCTLGETITLDIRQGPIDCQLVATVVRIRELGFKRYEVGVAFSELGPAERAAIRVLQQPHIAEQSGPRAYVAA